MDVTESERKNLRLDYKEYNHTYTVLSENIYLACVSQDQRQVTEMVSSGGQDSEHEIQDMESI